MSEEQTEQPPEPEQPEAPTNGVDWRAKARDWEKRAKANAEAARRLAQLEDANKTEAERSAEQLAQANQRAEAAEAALLRYEVASEKQVPPRLVRYLTGATKQEVEQSAEDLLEALPASASPPRAPAEATQPVGSSAPAPVDDGNAWFRTVGKR